MHERGLRIRRGERQGNRQHVHKDPVCSIAVHCIGVDRSNLHILPFIDKMDYAYAVSNFVICRAGAMTIAELVAMNLPSVLVPLPSAAANHQYKNAKTLADAGAAMIVEDNSSLTNGIENAIEKLKSNVQMRNDIKLF